MPDPLDPVAAFLHAACVPLDAAHASGTLDEARAILASHPEVACSGIHAAAVLGDETAVRRRLARDPGAATRRGGPRDWDPLTCLCFSRFLRLDGARSAGFVGSAAALLDAGANPNAGWHEREHQPAAAWESVLYGAAGVAHHAGLTRLLLAHGADPNDEEVVYHTPEGYDNAALEALVETGRLTADSLSLMLVRKHDWHDGAGVAYLLAHGADPNHGRRRGFLPLHHAIARDNSIDILDLLLDHGADPALRHQDLTAAARAARHGRADVLASLARRGTLPPLTGLDALAAACARHDAPAARAIVAAEPGLTHQLLAEGGELLARFAGVGNREGVDLLLDLGVPVTAPFAAGDGYWGVAADSQAIHVAAWRMQHATVERLLQRGAPPDAPDGRGRTPLALALTACVDSYWAERRSTVTIARLLAAGARADGIPLPTGYPAADALLRAHGAGGG